MDKLFDTNFLIIANESPFLQFFWQYLRLLSSVWTVIFMDDNVHVPFLYEMVVIDIFSVSTTDIPMDNHIHHIKRFSISTRLHNPPCYQFTSARETAG